MAKEKKDKKEEVSEVVQEAQTVEKVRLTGYDQAVIRAIRNELEKLPIKHHDTVSRVFALLDAGVPLTVAMNQKRE